MAVAKVIEITASSPTICEDAVRVGITRLAVEGYGEKGKAVQ